MKTFLLTYLLSLFSLGSSGVKITISIKEVPTKPLKINFLSHKLFTEADTLYTLTLADTETKTVTLLLSTPQFIDIKSPQIYAQGLFYIDPSQEYEFVYDQRQDNWEMTAGNVDLNKQLKSDYKAIASRLGVRQSDSASFVIEFLHLTDSLKLYNNKVVDDSEKMRYNYSRRVAFSKFVNNSNAFNHFRFDASKSDSVTRKIASLINLDEIDLSVHSWTDFNALRLYHLAYAYEIFREDETSPDKMDCAETYRRITKWTSSLSAPDEIKVFLIGDFMEFYSMIGEYEFTEEALVYLEEYLKKYPNALHRAWIEKEYKKRYDQLSKSSILVLDCEDVEGKKFKAFAYNEELLFIDFWATWCGPCIAENPYIDKLKKEYAGKVRFIKISVDDLENGWRLFLGKDPKNTEDSYLLSKNNRTETMNYYNLNAIPKFMIINRNGQVLDFTPPRPSDPKIREVLDRMIE
ncbi:MAG: thiol-disulfide isomerase/thioredoxin [Spirosomataceae bacterium]|jgi:thiol-disulfide isomerase/thioredoxin